MIANSLVLREFGACNLELTPGEYATLRARYTGKFNLTPTERAGVYRLEAHDHVGAVALPGERILIIEPKVTVSNLFYMLCVEAGVLRFYPQTVSLSEHRDIFSVILSKVISDVEHLIAKGLYQNYIAVERDLPYVKGCIALRAQINRHGGLKHRHVCRYAEATPDIAENRILAATLRLAAPMLSLGGETGLFRRARALLQHFDTISPTTQSGALEMFAQVRKHRLNRAYWPLLGLCSLILRGLSLLDAKGPHQFASFLIDMPRLFESFLTAHLASALPTFGLRSVAQRHDYLDAAQQVGIRPDILVYSAKGAAPLLVLDAKYRQPDAQHDDLNRDLYQVSAYMHRYSLSRGILVYPQWEKPGPGSVKLLGTPKELHIANLDLSVPDPASLDIECAKLAAQVAELCTVQGSK